MQLSTWPSNNANAFSGTLGADLPWKSRYAGTVSYTLMRQNSPFIPMSTNASYVLPASSLDGGINTLLSNNIITTKITPDLTSKLSYRYYDFHNDTAQLMFGKPGSAAGWISYDQAAPGEKTIQSLSMAYIKQNAGAELNWRPLREWNFGAAYGYERYDYTQVDATSTDENSGKLFADWKPTNWFTARSSGSYSNRTANNYNFWQNVGQIQNPGFTLANCSWCYSPAYQQLMIDDRQQWKANFAIDMVVLRGLTITPTFKYQDDYYGLNPNIQEGLTDSTSWSGGIDVTYVVSPDTSVMVGYMREYYTMLLYGNSCYSAIGVIGPGTCPPHGAGANTATFGTQTSDRTTVDTITAAVRHAAIPNKLDTELRYTMSHGNDNQFLFVQTSPLRRDSLTIRPGSSAWMRPPLISLTRKKSSYSAGRARSRPSYTTPGSAIRSATGRMTRWRRIIRPSQAEQVRFLWLMTIRTTTSTCSWAR